MLFTALRSEGEVLSAVTGGESCGSLGHGRCTGSGIYGSGSGCRGGSTGGYGHRRVKFLSFPPADAGEPTALVFATLYVKTERDDVTYIEGELVGFITKKVEMNLLGVGVKSLKHVFSCSPRVACF